MTAIPATRSRLPLLQMRLTLVLGSLVMAAALGLVSSVAWLANRPEPVDLTPVTAYGRGLAEVVAHSWLDGTPLGVATLEGVALQTGRELQHGSVAWDSFTRSSLPSPSGLVFERHRFVTTVAGVDADGRETWRPVALSVSVAFPDGRQPVLAAVPTLEPITTSGSARVFDYSDLDVDQLPGAAVEQLRRWAKYWATDDRTQLKQLTGDGSADAMYVGLGGFGSAELTVSAALPAGNTGLGADTWLVRARVKVVGANQYTQEMEMDLTVVGASSGLPRVIGWGPAGVGLRGPAETRSVS